MREYHHAKYFCKNPVKVRVRFPVKGYVREIFTNRGYGLTDTVDTVFTPTTLQLYSVLPYRVNAVKVRLPKNRFAPGGVIPYQIQIESDARVGNHTVRMDVIDPQGKESEAYSRNISCPGGRASGYMALALNDAKGEWSLRVKDITSGMEGGVSFHVE